MQLTAGAEPGRVRSGRLGEGRAACELMMCAHASIWVYVSEAFSTPIVLMGLYFWCSSGPLSERWSDQDRPVPKRTMTAAAGAAGGGRGKTRLGAAFAKMTTSCPGEVRATESWGEPSYPANQVLCVSTHWWRCSGESIRGVYIKQLRQGAGAWCVREGVPGTEGLLRQGGESTSRTARFELAMRTVSTTSEPSCRWWFRL